MPTYEYECPRCPRVFEVKQRITEPALVTCEVCGGPIHRLLSATPFILKGEGWYVTDYPSESRKKAQDSTAKDSTSKESASKESASKGDGGSAESKPAASSESKSSTESGGSSASSTPKPAASTKPAAGTKKPAAGKPAAGS
jgi:putative FmdB family regulatory protein